MPVQKLLAKIHIAKRDLGLDEETYREVLNSECGVRSAKFLDNTQAVKLIRYFIDKGWVPKSKPKKFDDQKGDIYSATPAQKRKIEVLWHDLYRGNSETKHLRQFLFNHFKVSDIRFLDKDKAYQAIEALKAMARRGGSPTQAWV
jgi:phage gp16-like protein